MSAKTSLNAKNLEPLGAERLAELLIEISAGNAAAKARLRLEIAAHASPARLGGEIAKRFLAIERGRTWIDAKKRKILAADLESQRKLICGPLAAHDPKEAFALLERLLGLAQYVHRRTEDLEGALTEVFDAALDDLAPLARAAKPDPGRLADLLLRLISDETLNPERGLIGQVADLLGPSGLGRLKSAFEKMAAAAPPPQKLRISVFMNGRVLPAGTLLESAMARVARGGLLETADAQGDIEAWARLHTAEELSSPRFAVELAARLNALGRAREALDALDRAGPDADAKTGRAWGDLRIEILEAQGRMDDAQKARRERFQAQLDARDLRAYLKRLPEFEDAVAEDELVGAAARHADVHAALAFLVDWPALRLAGDLVVARAAELEGARWDVLGPAADRLAPKSPLAATILWRAMITDALAGMHSDLYAAAARHLDDCRAAAAQLDDPAPLEPHAAFVAGLKAAFGRNRTFWSHVSP